MTASAPREGSSTTTRTILQLAWPAAASFLLNNAYRINDQFWLQGLGEPAQAAVGAAMFVLIMSFALAFLAAGGALSLVARAVGAGDTERMHDVIRHTLLLAVGFGSAVTLGSFVVVDPLVSLIGLEGVAAENGSAYLGTLFGGAWIMYLVPALDNVFIGRGRTWIPMALNVVAIALNFVANPLLIYGRGAAEALPGWWMADLITTTSEWLGIEGYGMHGAALATVGSRATTIVMGLAILRFGFGTRLLPKGPPVLARFRELLSVSAPASVSIALYAGVYWLLLGLVLARQPLAAIAALGIGFQVFEGISYPLFLGLGMACASLVGRHLGAHDPDGALEVVAASRRVARVVSLLIAAAFLIGAEAGASLFTEDPDVMREVVNYVRVLAISQYWVAMEAVNERVLLGAGLTTRIPWISGFGNAARVPLGFLFAVTLGWGPTGLWIAIVMTSIFKGWAFWREVERGAWLERLGR
ncbi:MAG: MATE family efflux transporter [Planctomycetota bacterium]|jgi:putative MATE family efflux protein